MGKALQVSISLKPSFTQVSRAFFHHPRRLCTRISCAFFLPLSCLFPERTIKKAPGSDRPRRPVSILIPAYGPCGGGKLRLPALIPQRLLRCPLRLPPLLRQRPQPQPPHPQQRLLFPSQSPARSLPACRNKASGVFPPSVHCSELCPRSLQAFLPQLFPLLFRRWRSRSGGGASVLRCSPGRCRPNL